MGVESVAGGSFKGVVPVFRMAKQPFPVWRSSAKPPAPSDKSSFKFTPNSAMDDASNCAD
jgi:hypothetical protein